nr:PREDICTED: receptor-type tyrosine-protein phosphatase-like N [Struthio camelus australis]
MGSSIEPALVHPGVFGMSAVIPLPAQQLHPAQEWSRQHLLGLCAAGPGGVLPTTPLPETLALGTQSDCAGPVCLSIPGCLFDRRLCSPQEVCVQDGLFGQCQVGSVQDRPYFQVTSPVLQRLQDVLRHLMAQGLSWQDGITQYVISQEMERIPRLRPPPSLEPVARDRFLPLRGSPRRALHPSDAGLPAAQHLGQPPPLLPSAVVQRYLEHLLLPSSPQLGYEEALLHPYSYHKLQFGYQDGTHQLPGSSARQSPETAALLGRVPAQALFGAGPVPSYGGQPGTDGGHLFQDLGMLSLPREKSRHPDPAHPSSMRLQHSLRLPSDFRDMEREQPSALAAQPAPVQTDAALKRLGSVLASYGLGLPELSPQQLSSLSTFLQLLQGPGASGPEVPAAKRVTEGDMQHGEEPEPPSSTVPPPKIPASSSPADGLGVRAGHTPAPQAKPQQGHGGDMLSPGKLVTVAKKSYTAASDAGEQQGMRPADEYGYIITDQKLGGWDRLRHSPAVSMPDGHVPNHICARLCAKQLPAEQVKAELEAELGLKIMQTGVGQRNEAATYPHPLRFGDSFHSVLLTFIALACVAGITSVSSQFSDAPQPSPSSHSSTPSWCEEPVQSNMDISTGHMILAYMEDHLLNTALANLKKNRNPDYVPYDHVRIKLKAESNPSRSDFINASPIIEHDPRMPAYIATQGPLSHTIADFWQVSASAPGERVPLRHACPGTQSWDLCTPLGRWGCSPNCGMPCCCPSSLHCGLKCDISWPGLALSHLAPPGPSSGGHAPFPRDWVLPSPGRAPATGPP